METAWIVPFLLMLVFQVGTDDKTSENGPPELEVTEVIVDCESANHPKDEAAELMRAVHSLACVILDPPGAICHIRCPALSSYKSQCILTQETVVTDIFTLV